MRGPVLGKAPGSRIHRIKRADLANRSLCPMKRRQFLEGCGCGLSGLLLASQGINPAQARAARAGRELAADLVIAGGGLGGCAAALAALGQGLTVVLTETTDWIGGQLTSQAVPPDEHPWIEQFG